MKKILLIHLDIGKFEILFGIEYELKIIRVLAQLLEDHFPNDINDQIQLFAKILDIDPICSTSVKKLLYFQREGCWT